ncbi:MAG: nucleotide exchange factor GrpE [Cyclobacteriaceae bacterium]
MEKNVQQDPEIDKKEELSEEIAAQQKPEGQEKEVEAKETEEQKDPFKKVQDDLAEAKDKYLRLYAEFDNYRRRSSKEKLEMIQGANERLIVELLPVIDDFERAEKAMTEKESKELEGFLLIQQKLKKILEQFGAKPMESEPGTDFDSDLHEAITQVPAAEEKLKGKIVDTVERGYFLNDRVIRHAKVVIGS